jgi:hypothetical protein
MSDIMYSAVTGVASGVGHSRLQSTGTLGSLQRKKYTPKPNGHFHKTKAFLSKLCADAIKFNKPNGHARCFKKNCTCKCHLAISGENKCLR